MPDQKSDRIPPQSLEAEQAALGSAMLQGSALVDVRATVEPSDFYREVHQRILTAMMSVQDRREPVDLLTLSEELRARQWFEQIGGVDYLMALVDAVPTAANAGYYAEQVKETSLRRRLIALAAQLSARAHDMTTDVEVVINELVSEILMMTAGKETRLQHISVVLNQLWDRIEAAYREGGGFIGLQTGFNKLDNLIGGMEGGDLMVIGARPSKGKSALSLQMALNVARYDPVLMCSLEMSAGYLTLRHLGGMTGIETSRLRRGQMEEGDFDTLAEAVSESCARKLWYFEGGAIDIADLQTQVRRWAMKMGAESQSPQLLIVDHLGFISAPGDNRVVEIGNAVLGIKTLAREMEVPAIVCCQLSRPDRGQKEKRPTLESLRESGHIEEHSDLVLLIHNPEAGVGKLLIEPVRAEFRLEKNRNGPTGAVDVMWDARVQRFAEIDTRKEAA